MAIFEADIESLDRRLVEYIEREEYKQWMMEETQEAIGDIEAGRVVSGEEVIKWLETWGTPAQIKAPLV